MSLDVATLVAYGSVCQVRSDRSNPVSFSCRLITDRVAQSVEQRTSTPPLGVHNWSLSREETEPREWMPQYAGTP